MLPKRRFKEEHTVPEKPNTKLADRKAMPAGNDSIGMYGLPRFGIEADL
jgi:hypothetical protein